MAAIAGPINLVKITKFEYADVTGLETEAPTTFTELLPTEMASGKANYDRPAASETAEYDEAGNQIRTRLGNISPSLSISLFAVSLSKAKDFLPGTYTAGTAGSTPDTFVFDESETVSNKYVKLTGLNRFGQTITITFYNAQVVSSMSGNMGKDSETVPLTIKFSSLYHDGLAGTGEINSAF